jgi:hypothetical protein
MPSTSNGSSGSAAALTGNHGKAYSAQAKSTLLQQGYAHATAEMMRHLVEMLYVAANQKLNHSKFTQADMEDLHGLVCIARETFRMLPQMQSKTAFEAFIRYIRKQKACKKDVLSNINNWTANN